MANYLDTTGLTALWGKIKGWANAQFTSAKLVITGYSKPSTGGALSATDTINQALGKLEKNLDFASSSVSAHDHDDRYYTETEADARFAAKSHAHSYNDLEDKPTIPPAIVVDDELTENGNNPVKGSAIYEQINDVSLALASYNELFRTAIEGKADLQHSHAIADVTNLQTTLDGKANAADVYTKTETDNSLQTIRTSVNTNSSAITTINQTISNIQSSLASGLTFKGTLGTGTGMVSSLPANHKKGDCYLVGTAATYVGAVCEVGDMIVCTTTGTAASNNDWTVLQNNLDLHPIATATIEALN